MKNNVITYESSYKDIDPPKRSEVHFIDLKVSFAGGVTQDKSCTVIVEHDEITIKTPSRRTSPIPHVETKSGGPTKTESPESPQTETHPIQEGAPGFMKN